MATGSESAFVSSLPATKPVYKAEQWSHGVQCMSTCSAISFCCCKAISIWVIGQDQINPASFSSSKGKVEHAVPLLGVGESDSGEVRVWQGLLRDGYGWR